MKKIFYISISSVFILSLLFSVSIMTGRVQISSLTEMFAGVFFTDSTTTAQLHEDYKTAEIKNEKVKILIVPGHDRDTWGTQFKGTKEVTLNLELAEYLSDFFDADPVFDVMITQDKNGYNPILSDYFVSAREDIKNFRAQQQDTMHTLVERGLIDIRSGVEHVSAPSEMAIKLYGINKWVNENNIDIVVHIHFNDEPTRKYNRNGKYTGFAIYVPERQFSNAKASYDLAEKVHATLKSRFPQSDMPLEGDGVVEDQELIAIGAYNSLDAAVMLMEYGYIYEPQFINKSTRSFALKEAALQTYLGIQDFFGNKLSAHDETKKILFPYVWKKNLSSGMRGEKDVFLLQSALLLEGVYPPQGSTLEECPISGNFFGCTKRAVQAFQEKYTIEMVGDVGPLTRAKLNRLYGF